jgi:hypothetical protein
MRIQIWLRIAERIWMLRVMLCESGSRLFPNKIPLTIGEINKFITATVHSEVIVLYFGTTVATDTSWIRVPETNRARIRKRNAASDSLKYSVSI